MFTIRDAIYLALLATGGCLWYADRSMLADKVNQLRQALASEKRYGEEAAERLIDARNNRGD